jgi:ATP-binding cassette, subfamily B, bacterial
MFIKLVRQIHNSIENIVYMGRLVWQTHPIFFTLLVGLQIFLSLTTVVNAWISKQIFDLLAEAFQNRSTSLIESLLPFLIVQATIELVSHLLARVNVYLNAEMGRKLHLKTRSLLYSRINTMEGLAYFEDPAFHNTMQIATQGINNGPSQILNIFVNIIRGSITLITFLSVLLFLDSVLALLVLLISIPHLFVQMRIGRQRFGVMYMNSPKERKASYLEQILGSLYFAKELRLFDLGNYFLNRYINTMVDAQATQRKQELREIRLQLALAALSSTVSSIAFVIVVLRALEGQITLGDVTLYTSAFGSIQGSLAGIIFSVASLSESLLFFSKFRELMALPSVLFVNDHPRAIQPLKKGIELRNVSFRYSENQPWILRNVNLFIPQGKCVAIVGANGAGKTTLVKLLARLYDPSEGSILWDGVDIREFDIKKYRSQIGAIFQDFMRYDLSAKENIGIGNVHEIENLERIQAVARQVKASEFLEQLPNGYNTILSRWLTDDSQGIDLSGGQWQKIATARMFMRSADFLILDEPTAAIDAQAEFELYQEFSTFVKGRTSFIISHRFSTVQIADIIAVLANGCIVEYGTHSDLMLKKGIYQHLFTMQSSLYK